ncbi:hypothetical protein ACEZ3G_06765 [Maribacter algicola]|uniref:Uncharacterized protein n=1 Tax=Meishania litoralis TaxID=3434685 RepID=A0ACC7LI12_9FLAO
MNGIDSSLLAQIFFGTSLVVFLMALYIILPGFVYGKRTVLKPKLVNAMWLKFYEGTIGRIKSNLIGFKKKELIDNVNLTHNTFRIKVARKI